MAISDLEEAVKQAKATFRADKTDKKAKKALKKAKAALAEAKAAEEAAAESAPKKKKKRSSDHENESSPKKKAKTAPSLDELKAAAVKAKSAFQADKSNKELKAAWKAAKKALNEAKAKDKETEKEEQKEKEGENDLISLKAALKAARKIFRQDKTNKKAKAAFKAAKNALAEAETKAEADENKTEKEDDPMDTMSGLKKSEPKPEENVLSGLKRGGQGTPSKHPADRDSQNPPSTRLFIRNVSYDIDDETITKFFEDCGTPVDIHWAMDRETESFKGFGFITFENLEQAAKAVEKNGMELMGRKVMINYSRPRDPSRGGDRGGRGGRGGGGRGGGGRGPKPLSEKPEGCTTVFCGNLPFDVDDEKITDFLSECGPIRQIRWLKDRETYEFKGAGFVEFDDPSTAIDKAVALNGKDFCGRAIRIDYAKPRAW